MTQRKNIKLIINIPTDTYDKIMRHKEYYVNTIIFSAITNGTPISTDDISDSPTNGDIIKALFPNYDYDCDNSDVRLKDECCILCHFPKWWWDTPYKK